MAWSIWSGCPKGMVKETESVVEASLRTASESWSSRKTVYATNVLAYTLRF
ncbi:hypothetical protein G9F72_005935 [Clostridium estertheticum]|uniref:hypothetical protein n=1 Tax=Clostridium estertheticum TaxID=238834 RepID=UPI001CD16C81|nr:hypothetical protein [Clostridium estertheticum]MBZ9685881.1 hypothetical protein [Clostridium estertheticum]